MNHDMGEWIPRENSMFSKCSECGKNSIEVTIKLFDRRQIIEICPKYCPHCGKRMRGPGTMITPGMLGDIKIEGVI